MNHYTYLIMYPDGTLYHGVRSCECEIRDDEYWGSSKYTPDYSEATKFILSTHESREEAVAEEIKYHKEINVKSDSRYHNKANQTSLGFDIAGIEMSPSTRSKMSIAKTGKNHSMYGKRHSTLSKTKMSAAATGRKHSADTCIKMSDSHTGKKHSAETIDKIRTNNGSSNPNNYSECTHCSMGSNNKGIMNRFHNDNCKLKQ